MSFYHDPTLADSPKRMLRGVLYVPYLLYEIIVSNLVVARVILDPSVEIDPRMTTVRAFVGSGFPLTMLANSITLTPGTLTVKADDQTLYVHSLLPFAREGLFDGSLERWVRFVFYGREAARFPSPRDRGDAEVLQQPTAAGSTPDDATALPDGGHDAATDESATPAVSAASTPMDDSAVASTPMDDSTAESTTETNAESTTDATAASTPEANTASTTPDTPTAPTSRTTEERDAQ